MKHKNAHEWNYLPELGFCWQYCNLCDQAQQPSEPKVYYTHKEALKLAIADIKVNPENFEKKAAEYQRNYANHYGIAIG